MHPMLFPASPVCGVEQESANYSPRAKFSQLSLAFMNKVLLKQSCLFTYCPWLFLHTLRVLMETTWPAKQKMFTILLFTEKVSQLLL